MTDQQCRHRSKYGRCERTLGHRQHPDDVGHEKYFDGTVLFRWRPGYAGWVPIEDAGDVADDA